MKQLWHETVLTAQEEGGQPLYTSSLRPFAHGIHRVVSDVLSRAGFSHILAEAGREDVRQVLSGNLGFREVASMPFAEYASEGTNFEGLTRRDPVQFTRLSIMKRSVPSNLY